MDGPEKTGTIDLKNYYTRRNKIMKKSMKGALALVAAITLCLAACGGTSTINISRSTDTTEMDLSSAKDTLTAKLTGIPSTGYEWTYEMPNDALIELTKTESIDNKTDSAMTGTSHTGDGTTEICFLHARNWEKTESDQRYEIEIKVEKGVITWMEVKNDEVPLPDEVKDFVTGSTSSVPVVYETESTSSKTV